MTFEEILEISPYSLNKEEKEKLLTERLLELTKRHKENCEEYARILDTIGYAANNIKSYKDLPFLPVRLFKELSLKSVPDESIVKTMTSSGTSGQKTSKIFLDRTTSSNQQKTMIKIVNEFTGSSRMPMIILDCPSVVKNRAMFSARGAGILGFSMFGAKKIYALDDNMKLDVQGLTEFLNKYKGQTIFMFGFTFMVWQYFYKELVRLQAEGITFDLSTAILIHGGGWKKLISEAVSTEEFHERLKFICGLDRIHDYYGMVEQTGCIYMQCECGHLHASIFSDVIVRNPIDFSEVPNGERGILQVVSTIPESYPGHSLLTEDEGIILGEDDCPCGRKGKYFKIYGRLKNAEIRGCSDTFAADHSENNENSDQSADSVLDNVSFLVGNKKLIMHMPEVATRKPFDESVVEFLSDLSKELMLDKKAKLFPDIVTLGFWLRKSSVLKLKERFSDSDNYSRVGRGIAFHIAPSNVPVNYAYSLFTGLICGNANIVRIPTKEFPQISIINRAINSVLDKYEMLKPYISLVRYEKNHEINDFFSSICDTRIIWGGDNTIADIRKSSIPPRATEITFADRYSLAVIDSDDYINRSDEANYVSNIAMNFYNDTYLSDQNACTSPRAIVWLGNHKDEAKKIFWDELLKLVRARYSFQQIQGVDKMSLEYIASASNVVTMKENQRLDNTIFRIQVDSLPSELMNYRGNSGYFYEYDCDDIMSIRSFCNNTRCQTIGVVGDCSVVTPLIESGIHGVDRVVSVGHTMDFDFIWDGYNLYDRLTRQIGGYHEKQ